MISSQVQLGKQIISELLFSVKSIKKDTLLNVVANIKEITDNHSDFNEHSVCTEFFSENELEEIVSCFRDFGFLTEIYFDENKFIEAVFLNEYKKYSKKNLIVYNSSQKGTGPGRKSLIPAFCNLHKIKTIGSNPYVVSLCRHKYHYNRILSKLGLPVVESWLFDSNQGWLLDNKPPKGTKIIIKPTYESASIGINNSSIVYFDDTTQDFIKYIGEVYKQPLTIQEFIEGYEIEVPVINHKIPLSIMPIGISINEAKELGQNILNYDIVYNDDYSFYLFNEITQEQELKILTVAENVIKCLGIYGFGRVDFRLDKDKNIFITDVSTNPHITKHSSFSYMFNQLGYNYRDLPIALVGTVLQ